MKKTITLLTVFILTVLSTFAQTTDEKKELYPDKYTFEKAGEFQKRGEYEKALWFYINLFPDNKTKVIDTVKTLAAELNNIDMSKLIKKTFALYGTFDPATTSFTNGTLSIDKSRLKLKGAWADELIQKTSNPNKQTISASEYNFKGLDKSNAGDFKGAIEDFNKALEIQSTGQIYFNRAYAKSMTEDFKGAIQDYDKSIELKYRLAEAFFERGLCKEEIDNTDGAIDDYTKAIELNNENANAYNNRAFDYAKKKNFEAALKDFDKAIKLMPEIAETYLSRGIVKKELGDKAGACQDWRKAVELGYKDATKLIQENCK